MQLFSDFNFDDDYLARLRARDDATWRHFIDCFYLPVRSQIRHKLPRASNVSDLIQDVFVAALRGIDKGQPRDSAKLPGYVSRICRNLIFHEWKYLTRFPQTEIDLSVFADKQISVEISMLRQLDFDEVHVVLRRLRDQDREIIMRVVLREEDRSTVAETMGITLDNLKVKLCRALQRFKREWDKQTGDSLS